MVKAVTSCPTYTLKTSTVEVDTVGLGPAAEVIQSVSLQQSTAASIATIKYPTYISLVVTLKTKSVTCLGTGSSGTSVSNTAAYISAPSDDTPGSGGGGGGGCLSGDTLITLANGQKCHIKEINIGDKVIAYDDDQARFIISTVTKAYQHHHTPRMMRITFIGGQSIDITPGHPILTTNG